MIALAKVTTVADRAGRTSHENPTFPTSFTSCNVVHQEYRAGSYFPTCLVGMSMMASTMVLNQEGG